MKLYELTAHELSDMLAAGEISSRDIVASCYERIGAVEPQLQAYVHLTEAAALQQAAAVDNRRAAGEKLGPMAGVPIAIKDLMCTRGVPTTCCSNMLKNFKPPYDATVVERCREAGMPMLGKTNMDEFAMGSSTENSAFQVTRNPWNLETVPGGSSGGSAAAVAACEAPLALGSDTGGSIRQPAALCGIVGMKPTYGRVSRYGIVAYASSLDQVGPLSRDVTDCAMLMNVLAGPDSRDATCADLQPPDYAQCLHQGAQGMRVGVISELVHGEGIHPGVKSRVLGAVDKLQELGCECSEVSLPNIEHSLTVYYIIATAECSSNLARYDGVRYGHRTSAHVNDIYDLFAKTRAEGFGEEVRLRIMLGTYALSAGYYDAYYLKALKVRTLIKQDFDRAWEKFDTLLCPTSPTVAWKFGEFDQLALKLADICTIPINIAGVPGLNIPCGFDSNMPVGLQLIGKPFSEDILLRTAYAYEQATEWHKQKPPL